jgi:hypothetical protein
MTHNLTFDTDDKDINDFISLHPDAPQDALGKYINLDHYFAVNDISTDKYEQLMPMCGIFGDTALLYVPAGYRFEYYSHTILRYQKIILALAKTDIRKFIIDVRGNGGGDIAQYTNYLAPFIEEYTLRFVEQLNTYSNYVFTYHAGSEDALDVDILVIDKLPVSDLCVYMNKHTGSSAEMLAHICRKKGYKLYGSRTLGALNAPEMFDTELGRITVPAYPVDDVQENYLDPDE